MSFLSSIFGGNNTVQPSQINYTPSGFSSSGLNASTSGGTTNLSQNPQLSSAIGNLSSTFGQQANALGQLGATVQPGFSQLRQAGLNQINTQQQATTSNLRDTLAQRRVLGSSFANASISQNDAEFAQQKANFVAQSYLQEVQTSQQLIQQQYAAATQQFSTGINQMNFESGLAAQLTSSNNQINAQIAQANANLSQSAAEFNANQANQSAAGIGKLFGSLLTAPLTGGTSLFGMGVNSIFGGSQPTPNAADFGGPGIGTGGYNFLDAQAA